MAGPKIVLLTDFSNLSQVATQFAVKMAANLAAHYTVLNVVRLDGIPRANLRLRQIEKTIVQIAEEEGARLIENIKREIKGNYTIEFKAVRGHTVADTVKRYTDKHPTNMVVMGSRGASTFKKARLGGTTVSVIEISPVPVLAIPGQAEYKGLKHIVYATDLQNVKKELDTIVEFARIFDAKVHMIHVVPALDKKIQELKFKTDEVVEKYNYKVDFKILIDDDVPAAIDQYIRETKVDLLTTFTHQLTFQDKLFARSVTRKLAYQGSIPLLAVRRKH